MNLATAKASIRVKEIGVKKTLGAARQSLIYQFVLGITGDVLSCPLSWPLIMVSHSIAPLLQRNHQINKFRS